MKELVKNFFIFGLATSLESIVSFLLLPIYARIFSVQEFGVLDLIQACISFLSIFGLLQLETSLQRYYFDFQQSEKGKFLYSIFLLTVIISTTISVLICLFANSVSILLFNVDNYSTIIQIACFQIPFYSLSTLSLIVLRFEKMNKIFLRMVLIKSILLIGIVISLIVYFKTGIKGIFIAQICAIGACSILSFVSIKHLFVYKISWIHLQIALKYSIPQFPARIGSATNTYANRFFILGFLNTFSVGLFSMALKFGSIMQLLHQTFFMAWNLFLFETLKNKNNKYIFSKTLEIVTPIIFIIVSLMTVFSYEIITLFATKEYIGAHKYIGGIALSISILTIKEVVDIGPKAKAKTYYLSISFLISLLTNIISLYFLVRCLNLSGVVFSLIITNLVLLILTWIFSNKLYYIPFNKLKFILLLLPTLAVVSLSMYTEFSFKIRFIIGFLLIIYHSVFIYLNYKKNDDIFISCNT